MCYLGTYFTWRTNGKGITWTMCWEVEIGLLADKDKMEYNTGTGDREQGTGIG